MISIITPMRIPSPLIRRIFPDPGGQPFLDSEMSSVTGKIELVKEYAERVPKGLGDYLQLKQAFYNLIKNACESMDQKGTLLPSALSFFEEWDLLCKAGGERHGERD